MRMLPEPSPMQRRFSMIRSFHLADWITVANALCGTGALFASMSFLQTPAERLSGDDGKVRYYEGTPIPTSLLLVFVLADAAWQDRLGDQLWGGMAMAGPWQFHPPVLMFAVSGTLMISTMRIPKP